MVADWIDCGLPIEIVAFEPVSISDLEKIHDSGYVRGVFGGNVDNGHGNRSPELAESTRYTIGSMVAAAGLSSLVQDGMFMDGLMYAVVSRELLDEFSITHIRHSPAVALSGGERRRVEIARALAAKPKFMLLDEPFAGIDPIAIGDIRNMVRQLTARGIGVLITDHNVRETLELIDRALIIHEGHVLTEGSPQQIVNDPDVRRYYLGESFSL